MFELTGAGILIPIVMKCDFNEDGKINISDLITLILYQYGHPGDLNFDFNKDGKTDIVDIIAMLRAMREGTCTDAAALLSSTENYLSVARIEDLTLNEMEYLKGIMGQLDLTPDEEAIFRLALDGNTSQASLPKKFTLEQNSPNPFNPATAISYSVPEVFSGQVNLRVFNLRGRLVRVLVDEIKEAGNYTVFWDGMDDAGRQIASGVYLYRMKAGNFVRTRKMVLLK
ncbi:MAG: T9SS type A sorting domain-containing protein [Candidatus Glassbacteria bacterium]|nr:T9SS type A sorting domain-containing protein [Candidatus Glassbacteria bacterium]